MILIYKTSITKIASSGGGTGGVSQAQVDSSIKKVTDPLDTRITKNEGDIKALQDTGSSKSTNKGDK